MISVIKNSQLFMTISSESVEIIWITNGSQVELMECSSHPHVTLGSWSRVFAPFINNGDPFHLVYYSMRPERLVSETPALTS